MLCGSLLSSALAFPSAAPPSTRCPAPTTCAALLTSDVAPPAAEGDGEEEEEEEEEEQQEGDEQEQEQEEDQQEGVGDAPFKVRGASLASATARMPAPNIAHRLP